MTSKVRRPARPLAQLNRVERHIKKQVQMSKVIDHLYAEHNDQLNYTYKHAREEGYSAARCEGENELANQKSTLEKAHRKQMLEQSLAHKASVSTLKNEIDFLSSVNAKDASFFEPQQKFLVENWRHGWKWISTWAFGLITVAATVPIPPEVLAVLPDHIRLAVIAGIAISGGILRFVNQSKPLPPADDKGAA
ncbi:hypothetical protein [Acinetobacter modestus]|uniref:DUF7940 domain-containing protein n=1 Tax=Acinetobacter modestus TaxID=1776740 RepID=UPI00301814C9